MYSIKEKITAFLQEISGNVPTDQHNYTNLKQEHAGRSLEVASGIGLWLVAYTLLTSTAFQDVEVFFILPYFWAWMAAIIGTCQLLYIRLTQRLLFTSVASAFWLVIAIYSFVNNGAWNLATAASMPFALFNFYVYGFVWHQWSEEKEKKKKNECNTLA